MAVIAIPHADDADDPRFSIADAVVGSLEEMLVEPVASLLGLGGAAPTS